MDPELSRAMQMLVLQDSVGLALGPVPPGINRDRAGEGKIVARESKEIFIVRDARVGTEGCWRYFSNCGTEGEETNIKGSGEARYAIEWRCLIAPYDSVRDESLTC